MGVQEWKNDKICILLIAWSEIDCSLMSDSLQLTAAANQQKIQWAYTLDLDICCGAHFVWWVQNLMAFVSKYACTLHVRFNLWNSKVCCWRAINSFSLLCPGVFCAFHVIVGIVFETNIEPRLLSVVKLFNGGRMCFPVLKRCINCLFFIFLFFLALCTLEHIAECSVHWQVELFDLIQDACGLSKQKRIFTILIFKELDDIC